MMKKVAAAVLAGVLFLALTACADTRETLIVGTEAGFAPYEYLSGEEIVGVDMDIAQAIADEMGAELEIRNMDFDSALAAVANGKVDFVAAGVSVTDERRKTMDFSHVYVDSTDVIVVDSAHPGIEAGVLDADGMISGTVLDDRIVGVQQGNIADSWVSSAENCAPAEVKRYTKFAQAVEDLKNGKIDGIVMDIYPAQELIAANEALMIMDGTLFADCYALAVTKGDKELLDQINAVIDRLIEDGRIEEFYANHTNTPPGD